MDSSRDYRLMYEIALSMLDEFDRDRVSVTEISRNCKVSKHTVYKNLEFIKAEFDNLHGSIDDPELRGATIKRLEREDNAWWNRNVKRRCIKCGRSYPRVVNERYLYGFNEKLKYFIRDRDNNSCMLCGMSKEENGRNLDVHHINWDWKDNRKENLISLCMSCHHDVHNRENKNRYRNICESTILYLYQSQQEISVHEGMEIEICEL